MAENKLADGRPPVRISVEEGNANTVSEVDLGKYEQPDISIDSGTEYAKHDVVGGPVVRQKTGETPREMTINGVCVEGTASKLHNLPQNSLFSVASSMKSFDFAQLLTVSTQPLDAGGAIDLDGEFVHRYTLKFVEVRNRRRV